MQFAMQNMSCNLVFIIIKGKQTWQVGSQVVFKGATAFDLMKMRVQDSNRKYLSVGNFLSHSCTLPQISNTNNQF
jgi:hypothetical protein